MSVWFGPAEVLVVLLAHLAVFGPVQGSIAGVRPRVSPLVLGEACAGLLVLRGGRRGGVAWSRVGGRDLGGGSEREGDGLGEGADLVEQRFCCSDVGSGILVFLKSRAASS